MAVVEVESGKRSHTGVESFLLTPRIGAHGVQFACYDASTLQKSNYFNKTASKIDL